MPLGASLWDLIPDKYKAMDVVSIKLNQVPVEGEEEDLKQIFPKSGDMISLRPVAGWVSLILLVVGVALRIGEYHWKKHTQKRRQESERRGKVGPSYALEIMQNVYADGANIPWVMGRMRGGTLVAKQSTSQFEEGVDQVDTLHVCSHGPIQSISVPKIDGNLLANYRGSHAQYRLGTLNQSVIPEYRNLITTVAGSNQLLSGAPITWIGTIDCTRALLKVYFPSGVYHLGTDGSLHAGTWKCRIRYRENPAGAWQSTYHPVGAGTEVDADSDSGQATLYVTRTHYGTTNLLPIFRVGDTVIIGQGTAKREIKTVSSVHLNSRIILTANLDNSHTQAEGAPVNVVGTEYVYRRRRTSPFSIWIPIYDFPSSDTYDVEVLRTCPNQGGTGGSPPNREYSDAYLKEFQQINSDDLIYPMLALAAVRSTGTEQLTGGVGRYTFLYEGAIAPSISSATLSGAPAYSRNPGDLFLSLLYNRFAGLGNEIDSYVEMTMTVTAGNYTVGEEVTNTTGSLDFIGTVKAWNGTTKELIVEVLEGFPWGTITGTTSGKVAVLVSIDECRGVNFPTLWDVKEFTNEKVPDGSGVGTTVNGDSGVGTDVLKVAATTGIVVGDYICVHFEGVRAETHQVKTVNAGPPSFTLEDVLTYTHTAVQADEVKLAHVRGSFDFIWNGEEDGWDAIERICKCNEIMAFRGDGNYVTFKPLRAETPTQLINMSNVRIIGEGEQAKSSFKIEFPEKYRVNEVTLDYLDEDHDFRKMPATRKDPDAHALGEKVNPSQKEIFGVVRGGHARRLAWKMLKRLRYSGFPIECQCALDMFDLQPGDVFWGQHDVPGIALGGGRVISSTNNTVTLDTPVTIAGGETIRIQHADDTGEARTISTPAGRHKTFAVTVAWTTNPVANEKWAVGDCKRYRCEGIELDLHTLRVKIQATEDSTAMYLEDPDIVPTYVPTALPDPDAMPPDVENLTLSEGKVIIADRGVVHVIDVNWIRDAHPSYSHAEIWLRELTRQQTEIGKDNWAAGNGNREFDHARGICTDGTNIFVADERNGRVLKYDMDLEYVAQCTGLSGPFDLCTDGNHVFVLETLLHRINVRNMDLTANNVFGAKGVGNGQFEYPMGICCDSTPNLYVADSFNHRIQKFTTAAGVPAYAAKIGTKGNGVDQFERPAGLDWSVDHLLIADTGNDRLVKLDEDLNGNAGAGTWATYGNTGDGDNEFDRPMDVVLNDDWSHYWIADMQNHRIHWRDGSDNSLIEMTGGPTAGAGRDTFDRPRGICWDTDQIFVVEYGNHRVQMRDDGSCAPEDWTRVGETSDLHFRIDQGVSPGDDYRVAVVSVSPNRVKKSAGNAPSSDITPTGHGSAPPNVANAYAQNLGGQVRIWWDAVICFDLLGYEIVVGADIQTGRVLAAAHPHTDIFDTPPPAGNSTTYHVRAVTTTRQKSATAATVSASSPAVSLGQSLSIIQTTNQRTD